MNENIEHFHGEREKSTIQKNLEGPKILKTVIRSALAKMKRNKSSWSRFDCNRNVMTYVVKIINATYGNFEIPNDLSRSNFIALLKKPSE